MGANTAYICVLCDAACIGYGNNPDPVNGLTYNDGRCCDDCNATRVIPARLAQFHGMRLRDDTGRF